MFFISNFIYTAVLSLPIMMLAPLDMDYKEVREQKPWTLGLFGVEYRPQVIESLSGNIALGLNWDWRYQSFDSESLDISKVEAYESQQPYVEASNSSKLSFYASYYLKEESSFFISFISNITSVPFKYRVKSKDSYANDEDRTSMKFSVTYIGYGVGAGWHCIWESGLSILVGLDFTITAASFSHVDSKQSSFQSKVKDEVLNQYEDEHLFPLSSKFMLGYSF